jgi:hypothetical protein
VPDPHSNFGYSTVATAPSPATSGTSLVVATGDGALFPNPATDGAFDIVIWPAGAQPTNANAEIARCTARSSDTLTIVRGPTSADPGGINRTVVTGDQVSLAATKKMFTDLEQATNLFNYMNAR